MYKMERNMKMINISRFVSAAILIFGLIILSYSLAISHSGTMTGIGIGTVVGSVFIFLMGIFFVATEEMLEKTFKGVPINPMEAKKERRLRRSFQ
jgi:hypothetical protein